MTDVSNNRWNHLVHDAIQNQLDDLQNKVNEHIEVFQAKCVEYNSRLHVIEQKWTRADENAKTWDVWVQDVVGAISDIIVVIDQQVFLNKGDRDQYEFSKERIERCLSKMKENLRISKLQEEISELKKELEQIKRGEKQES